MDQSAVSHPKNAVLSRYVDSIWTLKSQDECLPYLLPPDASFTCVFSFDRDTTVETAHGLSSSVRGDFVTGLRTSPVTLQPMGAIDYVAVQFKPLGFRALFGLHANLVTNEFVDLSFVSRDVSRERRYVLDSQFSDESRQDYIEAALLSIARAGSLEPPRYLSRAVERIQSSFGDIRVGVLCNELGITNRQLQREFYRWIGIPAKFYARIVRMNRALELLESKLQQEDLAQLAVSLGYYDQAHLCRDFAELVGEAPGQVACASSKLA